MTSLVQRPVVGILFRNNLWVALAILVGALIVLCDRIVVMKFGRIVSTHSRSALNRQGLIDSMSGVEV
jgi:ABC-type Na+ transport system ATPase subunit NatA